MRRRPRSTAIRSSTRSRSRTSATSIRSVRGRVYDEGKRFGEAAVAAGVRSRGLDARLVRFFNCYGPRMEAGDGRLVPELIGAALAGRPLPIQGTGEQTRSMTYVDDAVDLLLRVVAAPLDGLHPVNVGNDDERQVLEIARTLAQVAGVTFAFEHLPAREGDPQRRRPDLQRARALGWTAGDAARERTACDLRVVCGAPRSDVRMNPWRRPEPRPCSGRRGGAAPAASKRS